MPTKGTWLKEDQDARYRLLDPEIQPCIQSTPQEVGKLAVPVVRSYSRRGPGREGC